MISTWSRVLLKSLTWKIIGVVSLIVIAWLAGAEPLQIGKITFAYHILTWILYAFHERVWNKILWGKKHIS